MKRSLLAVLLLSVMASATWADDMGMSMPATPGAGASAADTANAAAMQTMMHDMAVKPSGNADVDFARMMLAHHRGAIAMARIELEHGKDGKMRALATRIIKAQESEIAEMQGWLARHR